MTVELIDNSKEAKEEIGDAMLRALETCGLAGEGFARKLCAVDTGNLRNAISHQVVQGKRRKPGVKPQKTAVQFTQ